MTKVIDLEEILEDTKKFYEISSDVSILQIELDQMLTAMEKNSIDFERGKIPKEIFNYNENKLKVKSAKMIKKINSLIDRGISLINKINKNFMTSKTETEKKVKEKKIKKEKVKKIKKKVVKIKEEPKTIETKKTETPTTPTMPATPAEPVPTQEITAEQK